MSDSPRSLPVIGARYPMWLVGIAICVAYVVAGKAGLSLAVVNASASPVMGTGFGLATTYGIIKQSGGFIWVNSQLGRGTVFHIYLPFVREAVETNEPAQPKVLARHGSETILVVEDDAAVRRLAHTVLRGSGYTVLEARDGEDALEIIAKHQSVVHLLITDVVMPGLTGADLAERLQRTYPDIRVLYTSGYSHNALISVDIDSSAPFLPKPFLPIDLLAKVEEVLTTTTARNLKPASRRQPGHDGHRRPGRIRNTKQA